MSRLQIIEQQLTQSNTASFPYVLKQIIPFNFQQKNTLKVIFITGGSRGIGLAIALRAAKDGAKIIIAAKTTEENPKLPGTIYTAKKQIEEMGGQCLAIKTDIRFEDSVQKAVDEAIKIFGRIDILINNASAISLTDTQSTSMKTYDLMNQINSRGTYLTSKICVPHLLQSQNAHILNISPPLNLETRWFANHVGYSMAKFGMSLCVLGMHEEFRNRIGVNALWPRTSIASKLTIIFQLLAAAVKNLLGGEESVNGSRTDEIMADSAYIILTSDNKITTGQYFIDDEVMASVGITDLKKYQINQKLDEKQLVPDFFC